MSSTISQYYPNASNLQKIKSILPKKDEEGTAAQKIAKEANGSTSAVYKVLNGSYQNSDIVFASCKVIIEDAEKRKAIALSIMQELKNKV